VTDRRPAVHQLLPTFSPQDAIGSHVLRLRAALAAAGYPSDIWFEHVHPALRAEAQDYRDEAGRFAPGDVIVYHASTGSPMTDWLLRQPQQLLVDYHNITEARFFDRWLPSGAANMRLARQQLAALARRATAAVAHSEFSRAELVDLGFDPTEVVPLLVAVTGTEPVAARRPVPAVGAHWLFVGRIAPNKCQHDLIAALAAARLLLDPACTLTLVGASTAPAYRRALGSLATELAVAGAVRFADQVDDRRLADLYDEADVFVCLSEHEGFCAPLLEAMAHGLPIVAFAAAAVPETVGDAAVLLTDKDPAVVAAAVAGLAADPAVVGELRRAGAARVRDHRLDRSADALVAALARLAHLPVDGSASGPVVGPVPGSMDG
jgi:glycosyltransferase involved in cell wall biosynthesis